MSFIRGKKREGHSKKRATTVTVPPQQKVSAVDKRDQKSPVSNVHTAEKVTLTSHFAGHVHLGFSSRCQRRD